MSKRRSLSVQLFLDVLCSLLAGCAVFAVLAFLSGRILSETVYADAFAKRMSDQHFARLQAYVKREGITAENLRPLDVWCSQADQVYLSVYLEDRIIYETPVASGGELAAEENALVLEDPGCEYALTFSDGSTARAFLYYYAGDGYYYWSLVISGIGAFLVFSLCFITLVHRKMRYVQHLKSELDILAGGDLNHSVTIAGGGELADLAEGINQMRQSILAHQSAEEQARLANSQLVTAMSHDLRTPLTALLGYLELMERGKYQDPEQLSHFIRKSLDKTLQIKSMADKLFEYFFAYASEGEAAALEYIDADTLFRHLLEEYTFSLESQGFTVTIEAQELAGRVRVDMEMLQRAFDNVYSNLIKYAHRSTPIQLSCRKDDNRVYFCAVNGICASKEKKESTNLGLDTCRRILKCHGGKFSCREEGECFVVEISLPLIAGA